MSAIEQPKPALHRIFEAVAAIMGLHRGRQTLELEFEDGRLQKYHAHAKHRPPSQLAEFDEEAGFLVERAGKS